MEFGMPFPDFEPTLPLIGSPINPVTLAGGDLHLQPTPLFGERGTNDHRTRVEVERLG